VKRTLTIIVICLFLQTAAVYARSQEDKTATPQDKTANRAQLLTTARITKIDTKKKILTARTENDHSSSSSIPAGEPQGSGRRSGRGGAGRRRNGGGFPGGGIPFPGGGGGGRPSSTPKDQGKEFKVVVSDTTAIKEGENSISFLNLNVGDHITIKGLPKGGGSDLEASEITLNH